MSVRTPPLTGHSFSERLPRLAAKLVCLLKPTQFCSRRIDARVMTHYPTVDRESFQKLLASAFVVQQSQMDSQSRAAIVELRSLITSGELDVDGAMHVRTISNIIRAAGDRVSGVQLPLLGLEGDRSTGVYPSPLASMLAAHGTGDLLTETALDPALSDTVAIRNSAPDRP